MVELRRIDSRRDITDGPTVAERRALKAAHGASTNAIMKKIFEGIKFRTLFVPKLKHSHNPNMV